ncbi:hypothetical protein [Hydrogenimonas cancrithermarum]|uniref:Uncharacterized protein n=1 Tax=Hydrogenimonas cancrithermarum TaxID=2993563 RepID=A0ABM8FNQ7_9BACT|nr:hypothetical protein [Hydrogenimonas cancrithermarum]BDY14026.1 hypothetical protein HCR_23390 [Hydrogenimonas cancrithermarum]
MENAFGNIPEKIRRSRQEIEREIENSKSDLIESLRKEKSGLMEGISQREKELLQRVEKILGQELKKSRWKVYALLFVLGVTLGAGSAAAITYWEIHKNNMVLDKEWEYGSNEQSEWYIRARR